jgi:hypothetical protein
MLQGKEEAFFSQTMSLDKMLFVEEENSFLPLW